MFPLLTPPPSLDSVTLEELVPIGSGTFKGLDDSSIHVTKKGQVQIVTQVRKG